MDNSTRELENLVRSYEQQSNSMESAPNLTRLASRTLEVLKTTGQDVLSATLLIRAYSSNSNCMESASNLANATCRTIEVLKTTGKDASSAAILARAYSSRSNCMESASNLANATCRTLEYLSQKNLDVNVIIERIEKVNKEERKKRKKQYDLKKDEICQKNSGLIKLAKLFREEVIFKLTNYSLFSASELCTRVLAQDKTPKEYKSYDYP